MKDNGNVLYIGGFELPDKNAAAQRVISNAKLFDELDYLVSFIGVTKQLGNTVDFENTESVDDFKFNFWSQQYPKSIQQWFKFLTNITLVKKIVKDKFNYDLEFIVVYNYPAITLLKLHFFCKKHKIKLIADITEWPKPQGNIFFNVIKSLDSFIRMRILHNKIDGVIVISNYLFNYYKGLTCIELPPLVDKNSNKWISLSKPVSRKIRIVYAGSAGSGLKDRLDYVILSLSRIKKDIRDFSFIIVGMSQKDYFNVFGINSIPPNVLPHIHFKGRKPHIDTIEIIKSADYTIFLRNINLVNTAGFPTKFVESVTCNTPVLTNLSSNISDFLKDGKLGYVLSISSEEKLDISLTNALNQGPKKLLQMQEECLNCKKFHFTYYKTKFQSFLKSVKE